MTEQKVNPYIFFRNALTREEFESRKDEVEVVGYIWHLHGYIKTPEVCECFLEYFANLNPGEVRSLFLQHLKYEKVDFLVKFLPYLTLDEVFSLKHRDDSPRRYLHLSLQRGSMDVIEFLFNNGLDINTLTINRETSLFEACTQGNSQLIDYLLLKGINVNFRKENATVLKPAIMAGEVQNVDRLICAGIDVTSGCGKLTPIELAILTCSIPIVERLIQMRVPLTSKAIAICVREGIAQEDLRTDYKLIIKMLRAAGCVETDRQINEYAGPKVNQELKAYMLDGE